MSPTEMENSCTDERKLDEERIEKRSSIHDKATQQNLSTARNIARQVP